MEIFTKSAAETKEAGKRFANDLIKSEKTHLTAALIGDLGSGKTTFVQGFAECLGINQRILSPTFILMRKYLVTNFPDRFKGLYHVDFYRIPENPHEEARNLGLFELWGQVGNIVLIEWGEKVKDLLPLDSYLVEFKHQGQGIRNIAVNTLKR
ncbi:tRNA (adenosine(37)-N6)-threonylcarbamoyltransferase complex ATPase subunit type 1 TsaE [Candidatus Woesebacteria bacterium RIFCSPHIGHO2_01_FULL_38_9]|uniref:tRNA threonylcarbamoyladenosine biosynthesis protein TsaE n=2 Tax=Candidatus Woeseibacteriota TaxID=1752722 RepID=A0A1F7Y258_9BACT|nr:MAG: tRNA (adenosine(37)-N6)-threonylcarbamoyltransferase complex ATPase subunit type 1 TsaE [Candidatus Woesebacteria bacterium RIFCSPHIGHO2_01_FULL_38_9]OGM60037.1 MAG: tRNA (adenosine(37)-N6)-threonylcarbamoyltransferase complex ATPase subunit type 1 TsaE [Candidatus Woesebacteria bacterium RIFCSPLOWO2_01_FULL_39_10]